MTMHLYLNHLSPAITTLGPGRRIGLWTQGCSIRCSGCMSPDLWCWEEHSKKSVSQVFQQIISYAPEHAGLTVSGGEPFEQPEAMQSLFSLVREHTSLDIMVYSGYTLAEILEGPQAQREMLALADVLMDGQYCRELPTDKLWRGSDNQQMHLLSKKVQKYRNFIDAEYGLSRPLQVEITAGNNLQLIGIPGRGDLDRFKEGLSRRGITMHQMFFGEELEK